MLDERPFNLRPSAGLSTRGLRIISTPPQIGDRITDKSASPDGRTVREWTGADGFEYWAKLRTWIDESYPEVFAPDWLYGGKSRVGPCVTRRPRRSVSWCRNSDEFQLWWSWVVRSERNLRSGAMFGTRN
jgi:hypothetical protein